MATALRDEAEGADLYHRDFYAWARQQAAALRAFEATRPNLPLDLEHLSEEVDALADSQLAAVESQLRRLMIHFLKIEHSPAASPRRKWHVSIIDAQAEIEARLTPSMRRVLASRQEPIYARARRIARTELADHDEPEAARSIPETCPYTLDQLLDETWRPANRHGLVDEAI